MIYNGPSIYNQGGGGGGFSDGGALVDGDFIEVTNNSISTYDNTIRDPVNFYFEVKDGEIVNSVIEMTTAVNATINVYVVKNGIYYLLGNVGGNTVTAGDDYKINIVGDSFSIENVSGGSYDPVYVELMGDIYGLKKINGLIWITSNFKGAYGDRHFDSTSNDYYYTPNLIKNINLNGFRIPTREEVQSLISYLGAEPGKKLKSTSGWYAGGNGTNESGLNIKPSGYIAHSGDYYGLGYYTRDGFFIASQNDELYVKYSCSYDSTNFSGASQGYVNTDMFSIRLVKSI